MRRQVGTLLVAVALGATLTACLPVPPGQTVSVWGDSLVVQTAETLRSSGIHVHAFGGTAPCDWASGYQAALKAERPTYVVIAFIGNYMTACMQGTTTTAERVEKYRAALSFFGGAMAIRYHVKVAFVVPILTRPVPGATEGVDGPPIGRMECALAATAPTRAHCDTQARDLLSPSGVYTDTVNGVVVRMWDGVHLTPAGVAIYAKGIVDALTPTGAARA